MSERKYPPVTGIAMTSLGLIVAGGIYLSAHLPRHVPIGPAVVLLVLSALLMAYNIYSLTRVKDFPWDRFFAVAKWSLLAYLVIAGLIEYAFLKNHLSGAPLVVLTLSLLIFAIHVPTLLGFTVARYYDPSEEVAGAPAG
jgi:peptidoglycan/LPS O-acetylase OafA/YrhL